MALEITPVRLMGALETPLLARHAKRNTLFGNVGLR